jgi:hypothetical protein
MRFVAVAKIENEATVFPMAVGGNMSEAKWYITAPLRAAGSAGRRC